MSSNVIETDTFSSTVPTPDTADKTYPAVVQDGFTKLASRTRHTHNTLTGSVSFDALDFASVTEQLATQYIVPTTRLGANNLFTVNFTRFAQSLKWLKQRTLGLKSGTQQIWVPPFVFPPSAGDWTLKHGSGIPFVYQGLAASTSVAIIPLPSFLKAGVLTTVTMRAASFTVHSSLPANMPKLEIFRVVVASPSGDYSPVLLGSATDSSAGVAAYEATHTVTVSGLNEDFASPITSFMYYTAKITGEWGANSQNDSLKVFGLELSVTGAT